MASIWDAAYSDTPEPQTPPPTLPTQPRLRGTWQSIWDSPFDEGPQVALSALPRAIARDEATIPAAPRQLTAVAGANIGQPGTQEVASSLAMPPLPTPSIAPVPQLTPTPLSAAAAQVQGFLGNLPAPVQTALRAAEPLGSALTAPTLAVGQEIGRALGQFGAETTGQEVAAAPLSTALSGIPGLNLAATGAAYFSPEVGKFLKTPLRDVPVLGGLVRGAETAAAAFQASGRVLGEPAVGTLAAMRETNLRAEKKFQYVPGLTEAAQAARVVQDRLFGWLTTGVENPQYWSDAGVTPSEGTRLLTGFLTGANTPEANRRFEEMARRGYASEAEQNPVSSAVLVSVFDPLTYLDGAGVTNNIGRLQELKRTWEAGVDVAKVGAKVAAQAPLDRILLSLFPPTEIKAGAKVTEAALGLPTPGAQGVLRRFVTPFTLAPQSKVTNVALRALDSFGTLAADESRSYAQLAKLADLMAKAATDETLTTAALKEFISSNKIVDSLDHKRTVKAMLGFRHAALDAEYKKARSLYQSIADAQRTTKPIYNEMEAEFIRAGAKELDRIEGQTGFTDVFERSIKEWQAGKLDLPELERGIERLTKYRLLADFTEHAATTLAKGAGLAKPNWLTRLVNTMRAYEGLLFVRGNPAAIAQNLWNTGGTAILHGAKPQTMKELETFWTRWGYRPSGDVGGKVSRAVGGAANAPGPYGAGPVPKWLQNAPVLKQMGDLWTKGENWGRQIVHASGMERFMSHNFKAEPMPDALENYFIDSIGEQGLGKLYVELDNARNFKEAEAVLLRGFRSWASYRDDIARTVTADLTGIAGRELTITGEMVNDAVPLATREQWRRVMQVANESVARSGDKGSQAINFPTAYRQAKAQVQGEVAAALPDLFPEAAPAPPTAVGAAKMPTVTTPQAQSLWAGAAPELRREWLGLPQDAEVRMNWEELSPEQQFQVEDAVHPAPTPAPELGTRISPEEFARQETALLEQRRQPDPNALRDFATLLQGQETVPNILRNTVQPGEWAQMDAGARQVALERALSQARTAGTFPLSDVYIGRGGEVVPMPDVTGLQDLSDVFRAALAKGIATATTKGAPTNRHLLNVLNKHKAADAAAFATMDEVAARADEAIKILEGYTPTAKPAPPVPPPTEGRFTLAAGEPEPLDAMAQINASARLQRAAQRARDAGPAAVLDNAINQEWQDAVNARMLEALERAVAEETTRAAHVLPPDLAKLADQYLRRDYMPALNTAKQGANAAGRYLVEATVLNYDHRWNVDDTLLLAAPFTFWWLHTALNYTKDFIDHPALLAFYTRLRENLDKQAEGMPPRYQGRVQMPMPLAHLFGVGDALWVDPVRPFFPADDVFQITNMEHASFSSIKDDGTVDPNRVFDDVFGIHTPIKLGMALATGNDAEVRQVFASLPAARLLRGATAGLTPGGVGLESKYDKFYYERALKELVAEGTLTAEQAQVALLQQSGPAWEAVKRRAGIENYQVRELSGAVGLRGYAFTPGEQQYLETQRAKETLLDDAVRRLGGNPNLTPEQRHQFLTAKNFYASPAWRTFQEQHPESGLGGFISQGFAERPDEQTLQQARAKDYYIDKIWEAYRSAPELKQKLIYASLGNEFQQTFVNKPKAGETRDYSQIPMKTILGWANALDVLLENVAGANLPNPDPYKVTFTTADQNARYQEFYDSVEQAFGWQKIHELEQQYFAIADKGQRKQFLEANPMLKIQWDAESKLYDDNPDLLRIMEQAGLKKPKAATATGDPKGAALVQAVAATGLDWDTINAKKAEYNALPKGTGARTAYLKRNPDLLRYFQLAGAIYKTNEELDTYGGGGGTARQPFYTRPSYQPHLPRVRTPTNRAPFGAYTKYANTRAAYALFANLRRKYPNQPQQPLTAYQGGGFSR